jgi:superfamily I DNA/RNA helicase
MSTNYTMKNKYPGACLNCGTRIGAGQGIAFKQDGGWKVRHEGECPTTVPDAPAQPEVATVTFTPTPEQAECIALFATGQDLVIQAGAGTGKTATLLLLANWAGEHGKVGQYTAYNRAIVDDIKERAPGHLNVSTMHGLAYRAYGYRFRCRLNARRQRAEESARILGLSSWACRVDMADNRTENKTLPAGFLAGLVIKAVEAFTHSADDEVAAKHFRYVDGLDLPRPDGTRTYANNTALAAHLLPFAQRAWRDLNDPDGTLRYWPDCYLKAWQLGGPTIDADYILLDEAQDADPVQVEIIKAQRKFGTQIVCVGDSQQVLYDWRGAVNALADFAAMGANVAYLSQSFRFGDAVADVANGLLSRLEASLRLKGYGPVASVVGPVDDPDAILCRTNAGAVRNLLQAIERGRKAVLVGGGADVIGFCKAAVDLQAGERTSWPELACFSTWKEVEYYAANDEQGEDLRLMVRLVNDFGAQAILDALEAQPDDAHADVVISTAHKSKGRQWGRVQIGNDFKAPKQDEPWPPSEVRLAYVASTRAQRELDLSAVPHFTCSSVPAGSLVSDLDLEEMVP